MQQTTTPEPHPWNQRFEPRPPPGAGGLLDPEQLSAFIRDGYLVIDGLFAPEEIETLREAIDAQDDLLNRHLQQVDGERIDITEAGAITFFPHLVTRLDLARRFACDERFARLCADLVGPDVNLYWDQSVYKRSEKPRRFPWHQDNGYVFVEPQDYLTCWVALNDATVENGCPHVVPGLHKGGTYAHHYVDPLGWEVFEDPGASVVPAPVRAGGVVVFSSLTPHMTPSNRTEGIRKAYILQYVPAGAAVLSGDPGAPPTDRIPCDDPDRQFPVLRANQPVLTA